MSFDFRGSFMRCFELCVCRSEDRFVLGFVSDFVHFVLNFCPQIAIVSF